MAANIKDVAKAAGLSVGTVSRVLNNEGAVSAKSRQKVMAAIDVTGYKFNNMARQLRRNESRIIALLVPTIDHPFFSKFAFYAEDELAKCKYSLMIVCSQFDRNKERNVLEKLKRREVDGVIFVTHYDYELPDLKGYAIVSVDRHLPGVPFVTSNNYEATGDAIRYLVTHGAERIAYLGSRPEAESEVMERRAAYVDAMREEGRPKRTVEEIIKHGEEQRVVEKFFDDYPEVDGVFVSGDLMAAKLYREAVKRGYKIPEDLQIISYDGIIEDSGSSENVITAVRQPIEKMARKSVELVIDRINKRDYEIKNVFTAEFIKGKSTK